MKASNFQVTDDPIWQLLQEVTTVWTNLRKRTNDKANNKDESEVIKEIKQTIESLKLQNNELTMKLQELQPNEKDKLYKKGVEIL